MSQPADPCNHADSAGVPWAGRSFAEHPYAGDDGAADPALLQAITDFRAGAGDQVAVIDALRSARVLAPLVAATGNAGGLDEPELGPYGLPVDKTQELSIVKVAAPDGRSVLPLFTSVTSLAAWDATARPVPSDARRAALSAVADDTDLIVLDPGSDTEFVVRRPAVWAIAQDQPWEPAFRSADVYAGLHASIGTELAVVDLAVESGDPAARLRGPELVVRLELMPGLDQTELDAVLARLASRWAADDRIAVLVDSLAVQLVRGVS